MIFVVEIQLCGSLDASFEKQTKLSETINWIKIYQKPNLKKATLLTDAL